MLAVEDYIDTLSWAKGIGGLTELMARADANTAVLERWVAKTPWIEFLAKDPATRSNTSGLPDSARCRRGGTQGHRLAARKGGAAYDIGGYRDAPPGCGYGAARPSMRRMSRR